jgi:hypothetical protein
MKHTATRKRKDVTPTPAVPLPRALGNEINNNNNNKRKKYMHIAFRVSARAYVF